jgi:DDE superfamily endonuclease
MEARYALRKTQWLDECPVAPESVEPVIPRLSTFMKPCVNIFPGQGDEQHAKTYVCGLLSDIEHTNMASMADRFGPSRLPLQGCMGWHEWDDEPVRPEWRSQVKTPVGQGDGVLGCDPSGLPTSGGESGGVARPWWGRLGTVDHCPVAIDLGYVSRQGHTVVDTRLDRPQAWPKHQARLDTAGVPHGSRGYRPRHQLAWERLAKNGAGLPHRWMAGADEMGRPSGVRRRLAACGERSWLAVPSHTTRREREVEPPAARGRGRRPRRPWPSVEAWRQSLADEPGLRSDVRDGATGPLGVETVQRRVVSSPHRRQQGDEERLVVRRDRDRDQQQGVQVEDALSNAVPETPLGACARVAKAAQRIEACLQRSKSATGLADDEGRRKNSQASGTHQKW